MKIRTNRFIKLFVTLLFLLEFLAPALPLNTEYPAYDFDQSAQLKKFHHLGILLTLFSQPINENEEERQNDKNTFPSLDIYGSPTSTHARYFINVGMSEMYSPSICFKVHPSLYQLHHRYLI
jgi:hypothetical protein